MHPKWRFYVLFICFLILVVVGTIGVTFFHLFATTNLLLPPWLFVFIGVGFGCIPLVVSIVVFESANYKCTLPYINYANGILTLKNDTLQYEYWKIGIYGLSKYDNKHTTYMDEDKFVYSIKIEDIRSIAINNNICKIVGNGKVKTPWWIIGNTTKEYPENKFKIMLAFEQEDAQEQIIKWLNKNKNASCCRLRFSRKRTMDDRL